MHMYIMHATLHITHYSPNRYAFEVTNRVSALDFKKCFFTIIRMRQNIGEMGTSKLVRYFRKLVSLMSIHVEAKQRGVRGLVSLVENEQESYLSLAAQLKRSPTCILLASIHTT